MLLDEPYSRDSNLIKTITALSWYGEDPTMILKSHDASKKDVYKIFGTSMGMRGVQISLINDPAMWFQYNYLRASFSTSALLM